MNDSIHDNYTRPMNGGLALAEMLRLHGADTMFGMAGFQLAPFYEAVRVLGMGHKLINDEEEHDPGMPSGRYPAPGGEGVDPN
jgi:hypothetical protein